LPAFTGKVLPIEARDGGAKAFGAQTQRVNQGDELRHQVARKHQAAHERRADNSENDLGESRQQDREGLVSVHSGRDADDSYRVAGQQKSIRSEVAQGARRESAQRDPQRHGGEEEIAILGQSEHQHDRHQQPADRPKDAVEAFGEDEAAVGLGNNEHRQQRPPWFVELKPELEEQGEEAGQEGFQREYDGDDGGIVRPANRWHRRGRRRRTWEGR